MEKYRPEFRITELMGPIIRLEAGDPVTDDLLNVRIDFVDSTCFRVAMYHRSARLLPTWAVAPGDTGMPREGRARLSTDGFPGYEPEIDAQDDGSFHIPLGEYTLIIRKPGFTVEIKKGENTLMCDRPYIAYNYSGEFGNGTCHYLKADADEEIFGVGEKTGPVNRHGLNYRIEAHDSMGYDATSSDPLYKHLPFFICRNSVGSYGIYYDTHALSRLNFTDELDNYYGLFKSFTSEDDVLVYYVFLGSVSEIARKFAWLCGRSVLPPKWTLDYCGSTMTYTEAEDADARLRGFVKNCEDNRLACSGFYLSSGYTSDHGRRYVFTWNTDKIPDPKELVSYFREHGIHLIPNVKPAFLETHPMYDYIARKGWFLHYPDGTPSKQPFWDGYGSYLDFTNPEAFDFWTEMVREKLIDYGMDATWNDNNEYHITDRSVMADGFGNPIPARRICQVFPLLMVMASHRAQADGIHRQMLSTRSGCAGLNRLAQTWTGDNRTSFTDLKYNHKMAMGMSLSAMPLLGHDVGGFAGDRPEPELFMRWLQYGVLLPRFCIHSWNNGGEPTEPWMYPDKLPAVRRLFELRHRIRPYLYNLLYRVHSDYDTFLTPVFTDYPEYDVESDCFLLGHDVLAACCFNEGEDTVTVTLPGTEGWYLDRFTAGINSAGYYMPGTYTFSLPVDGLPLLFHRAGSVFAEDISPAFGQAPEKILYTVYPARDTDFTAEFFNDGDNNFEETGDTEITHFSISCRNSSVSVECSDPVARYCIFE